jgi:hypothetical protein
MKQKSIEIALFKGIHPIFKGNKQQKSTQIN